MLNSPWSPATCCDLASTRVQLRAKWYAAVPAARRQKQPELRQSQLQICDERPFAAAPRTETRAPTKSGGRPWQLQLSLRFSRSGGGEAPPCLKRIFSGSTTTCCAHPMSAAEEPLASVEDLVGEDESLGVLVPTCRHIPRSEDNSQHRDHCHRLRNCGHDLQAKS